MTREQIEKQVAKYLTDSINGLDVENPKVDFKRQWYDLTELEGINEFLKDTTAIANTVGLEGFIIIGFDDKNKSFHPATFRDSNLSDSSKVPDLLIKKCSNLFDLNTYDIDFNGNHLSIIHVPPTLEKPIFIINYQKKDKKGDTKNESQRVFIRKNSTVREASKYDIEMMFYDRKNIQPEYDIDINLYQIIYMSSYNTNQGVMPNMFQLQCSFSYEILGRKSIHVFSLKLKIVTKSYSRESLIYKKYEILKKGEAVMTGMYYFGIDNLGETNFQVEVANRVELKLGIEIEMNNGRILYKEFDFIPPFS